MVDLINSPNEPQLLIDGDIFLYRCGFAVEKTKYLVTYLHPDKGDLVAEEYDSAKEAKTAVGEEPDYCKIWSRKETQPVENAIQALKTALNEVFDQWYKDKKHWKGQIYLTGKGNFRDTIETDRGYKDNRDPSHRPKHYKALKDHLIKYYRAQLINGMEADDAIGIRAYELPVEDYVVVSNDKDLDQIAGFHYDWTKKSIYFVNDEDAMKMFYKQLLYGDPTDNIKGPLSEAKADDIVAKCSSPRDLALAAKEAYEKAYGDDWGQRIEAIGELVWIRKDAVIPQGKPTSPFWKHLHG